MRNKVLLVFAVLVVAVPASLAVAEKFKTKITAQTNDENQIFGVVRSSNFACEKRREVRLYGPELNGAKRGNGDFRRYDETVTNRFGEYRFGGFFFKRGGGFPDGDYFTRALRKDFPGDVCRRDDSPTVTIFTD